MGKDLSLYSRGINDVASGFAAITPSNTTRYDNVGTNNPTLRAITIGTAGNVALVSIDGSSGIIPVSAGQTISMQIVQVLATGTTAQGITGYW